MKRKIRDEMEKISTSDLRALLFWANVGVSKSRYGYQGGNIKDILYCYSKHIKFPLGEISWKKEKGDNP